jgi:pimeloyl-ACP methyl ester carboxylesterase
MKTNGSQGNYVQVNGLTMYYETHGSGIPVVLLHGGMETCQMWVELLPFFSEGFQLITPDSRGHGRTDNPSGKFSYPLMAIDIVGLIQALDLKQPFVAGYSDGGQVALELAISYPGLSRGYMIGGVYHTLTKAWLELMQGPLGFESPGVVDFERVLRMNPELVQTLQERHEPYHEPGYWKAFLRQLSTQWMVPLNYQQADFRNIIDPVLFWCGDRDVFCPPEQSLELYRWVENGELAVIPGADHFSIALKADLIAVMMGHFIREITPNN